MLDCRPGPQGTVRWAIAGRKRSALDAIKSRLAPLWPAIEDVPTLLGDAHDPASLDAIAASAKAVVSLTGPYNLVGEGMVAACVRNGTHYVDLTGELQWVRAIIRKYHDAAAAKGVRIVPSCGFEAAAIDLGTYLVASSMKRLYGRCVEHIIVRIVPYSPFFLSCCFTFLAALRKYLPL